MPGHKENARPELGPQPGKTNRLQNDSEELLKCNRQISDDLGHLLEALAFAVVGGEVQLYDVPPALALWYHLGSFSRDSELRDIQEECDRLYRIAARGGFSVSPVDWARRRAS